MLQTLVTGLLSGVLAKVLRIFKEPVLTMNYFDEAIERGVFVSMKSNEYEAMQEELAKAKLLSHIALAEREYAAGQYTDAGQIISSLREKYGL